MAGVEEEPGGPAFDVERERVRLKVRRALVGEGAELEIGRFVVQAPLGAGANGMVYVAFDALLGRKVAVKLLSPRGGAEGSLRLRREAQALARINHANVVTVYEAGDHRGCTFIALELVEGRTLTEWLAGERPGWRRALGALAGAARGLHAAHEVGVLHRDVKPANLVVDAEDRVRVLDFGLARASLPDDASALGATVTRAGVVVGTPAYMAPEQLAGEDLDARADQFGFCATAWEAVYGQRPFRGDDRGELLAGIRAGLAKPPEAPGVPAAVHAVLRRGLAARREDRYPTMAALADAMDRVLEPGEDGELIAGRYRLGSVLGTGGMAVVYEGSDEVTGEPVAVKIIHGASVERAAEARAASAAGHPGITRVLAVATSRRGETCLVMERVFGDTVRELIRRGPVPWREGVRIACEAAAALHAAHEAGLVHRDVKPENIMVARDGRAVVIDFGLAQEGQPAGARPDPSRFAGTPAYLSPEQIRGERATAASDQFALAVTAYELLTGRLPWSGEPSAMLAQIGADDPPRPSALAPALPSALDEPILHALAKAPAARHASITAFAAALRDAPGEKLAPAGKPARSRRGWILGGAAIALAAAGVTAATSMRSTGRRAAIPPTPAVVACPILEARGIDEPTGWLGAAAATTLCRRLTWVFGGREARTLPPAVLLDLPVLPRDDYPRDPYAEPDARTRSLAAARRAGAYLDGSIERSQGRFRLELTLMDGGRARATGSGEGQYLFRAVAQAVDALIAAGAIEPAATVDPEVAAWMFVRTPADGLALLEIEESYDQGPDHALVCARARALRSELGQAALHLRWICDIGPATEVVDRAGAAELAATVPDYIESHHDADLAALAGELARARAGESSRLGQARLAAAEARVWLRAKDFARARSLALMATAALPRSFWIRNLVYATSVGDSGMVMAARASAAWVPDIAGSWLEASFVDEAPEATEYNRRSYFIRPSGVVAISYAAQLVTLGQREEARLVAAELAAAGEHDALAADYVLSLVDASEARFARALERVLRRLAMVEVFGHGGDGDVTAFDKALYLGDLLGQSQEVGETLAQRFVLTPGRLVDPSRGVGATLVGACRRARRDIALACLERVRQLPGTGSLGGGHAQGDDLLLAGAEKYVRGDLAGAVDTWRTLIKLDYHRIELPPEAFDAVGELDIGSLLDERRLRLGGRYNGADPAHVREAKRAAARGDQARARQLAEQVIDAWSTADAPVPAVDEMRALLRTLD